MNNTIPQERLARRLKWYREQRKLTQDQLSSALGFADRQTLAAIEAGERRVAPHELVTASKALNVELDALLDPFRLVGEGQFSFRVEEEVSQEQLESFAQRAGKWIATYRELGRQAGCAQKALSWKLELQRDSTFEEAQQCAESLWSKWKLGKVPAARLEAAIERELDVLVLYVDAPRGVSGAASQLPGLQAIMVNRRESRGRRRYDLAHELFHVLTWDAMPPDRVEPQTPKSSKGNRVEQLANNFAAALLMPSPVVNERWSRRGELDVENWLSVTADALQVSVQALQWRLVDLKFMARSALRMLTREAGGSDEMPMLFSQAFVNRVREAVEAGHLSVRKAAKLLDLTLQAFAELCRSYGKPLSYDDAASA